jgi:hypothetical protein
VRWDETEGPFLKVNFLDDSKLPRFRGTPTIIIENALVLPSSNSVDEFPKFLIHPSIIALVILV